MFTESNSGSEPLNADRHLRSSENVYEAGRMSIEEGLGHGPPASEDGPKSGALSTQFNIMNTVMGVAILSLPNVFYVTGILPGIIGMVLFYFMHYVVCVYLVKAKNNTHHANFTTIGKSSVGVWSVPYTKFVMIFNAIGVCQLYLSIFYTVFRTFVITIGGATKGDFFYDVFSVKYYVVPAAG